MVARIVSEHVIELYIVDFIGSLCLEPLQDDGVLLVGDLHAEVVEDGSESGEGDEARPAFVLILEVWLD